jgi:dTDP-4-dehydrorhamnose 3,5-epimerase
MNLQSTDFDGLFILEPKVFGDERGFFMESYNKEHFKKLGIEIDFVQDNQSRSVKNVLRGLHFQNSPKAQTKLVRVLKGTILDVVVDLRKNKLTFGKSFGVELSEQNKKQLLVPKGFAHGFLVLTDIAEVLYKCDEYYSPEAEAGIKYDDPYLKVNWGVPDSNLILSEKDKQYPKFQDVKIAF